jgi:excisionase family DNA binding protein
MNAEIKSLFAEYLLEAKDPVAAAVLTLADVFYRPTPEPAVIEPDDKGTLSVKEAASRLSISSKKVYQMCLAGQLRCTRIGGRVRISLDEIERYQARWRHEPGDA